ncbi:MAG TPA: hypothetical protein VMW35_17625 [Myxococcota bacterium]|nr:hypothetical protein [Myxococcota bacterium]
MTPTQPGNAGARPAPPPTERVPPATVAPPPNPAREVLEDRRDLERCATGEITVDRHGRPCP